MDFDVNKGTTGFRRQKSHLSIWMRYTQAALTLYVKKAIGIIDGKLNKNRLLLIVQI